jgi:hypothetical protein
MRKACLFCQGLAKNQPAYAPSLLAGRAWNSTVREAFSRCTGREVGFRRSVRAR